MLLTGPAGVGKGTLVDVLSKELNTAVENCPKVISAVSVRAPSPHGTVYPWRAFYKALLKALHDPLPDQKVDRRRMVDHLRNGSKLTLRGTVDDLRSAAFEAIDDRELEVIFIDEAMNFFVNERGRTFQNQLDVLRDFCDEAGCKVVMVCTPRILDGGVLGRSADGLPGERARPTAEFIRRATRVFFPRYAPAENLRSKEFRGFQEVVKAFSDQLPAEVRPEFTPENIRSLQVDTIGCIGNLVKWYVNAISLCVDEKARRLEWSYFERTPFCDQDFTDLRDQCEKGEEDFLRINECTGCGDKRKDGAKEVSLGEDEAGSPPSDGKSPKRGRIRQNPRRPTTGMDDIAVEGSKDREEAGRHRTHRDTAGSKNGEDADTSGCVGSGGDQADVEKGDGAGDVVFSGRLMMGRDAKRLVPLYGRDPIGAGTPLTESLSSFVGRLSIARHLMPSTICIELVRPLVPEGIGGRSYWRDGLVGQSGVIWDDRAEFSEVLVQASTKLTALDDLSLHTLLPWRWLFSGAGSGALYRRQRRWCASCLAEWRAGGVDPWEPLLWRVAPVRRCSVHGTVFSEACPKCGAMQGYMPGRIPFGTCRGCGHDLEEGDPSVSAGGTDDLTAPWARWERQVSYVAGQMLASQKEMALHAGPRGFLTLLERERNKAGIGNIVRLAKHVDVSSVALTNWLSGNNCWRLESFLRVCLRLRIDPLSVAVFPHRDFVELEEAGGSPWVDAEPPARLRKSKPGPCRHWSLAKWKRVEKKLNDILEGPEPERHSVRRISSEFGFSSATLRRRLPEQHGQFKVLYEAYRKRRHEERVAGIVDLIRPAYVECAEEGIVPMKYLVFRRAGLSELYVMNPDYVRAWGQLEREFGVGD